MAEIKFEGIPIILLSTDAFDELASALSPVDRFVDQLIVDHYPEHLMFRTLQGGKIAFARDPKKDAI
jgi:hypothetical protein